MRVIHIINDLTTGGAQKMLCKLVIKDREINNNHHIIVVVLKRTDDTTLILSEAGVEFFFLFGSLKNFFGTFIKLYKFNPNVIQSWLYISDLISVLFKLIHPSAKLIWNIRNGLPSKNIISKYSWISARICSKLSFITSNIICPSITSINHHVDFGYCKSKFVYIPNFIDPIYAEPMVSLGNNYLKKDTIIFGVVTRFDEQKGIDTLLKAISKLPFGLNIKFHFIGTGMTKNNIESKVNLLQIPNLFYKYHCLEKQNNLFEFYTNIDFHISPSKSEAFPNAVFESMFMGKPNIATNAGDSNILVSDIGFLVDVNDHEALAKAIIRCVKIYNEDFKEYLNLSRRSHQWIKTSFDTTKVIEEYNKVWKI